MSFNQIYMAEVDGGGSSVSERPRADIGRVAEEFLEAKYAYSVAQATLQAAADRLKDGSELLSKCVRDAVDGVFSSAIVRVSDYAIEEMTYDPRARTMAFVLQLPVSHIEALAQGDDSLSDLYQVKGALDGLGDVAFRDDGIPGRYKVERVELSTLRGVLNGDRVAAPAQEAVMDRPEATNSESLRGGGEVPAVQKRVRDEVGLTPAEPAEDNGGVVE